MERYIFDLNPCMRMFEKQCPISEDEHCDWQKMTSSVPKKMIHYGENERNREK